jgi:hypothetical protein
MCQLGAQRVRFHPKGHSAAQTKCPLWAKSGQGMRTNKKAQGKTWALKTNFL